MPGRTPVRRLPASPVQRYKEIMMTKGHKSGRHELKPSLIGHKVPARRADSPQAAQDGRAPPEVGRDVDCELPDADIVRDSSPRPRGSGDVTKTGGQHRHKVRGGPDR
jgi:hypothetical protein